MSKGCIISAIVVFVLCVIGIGGCVFFGAKYGSKFANGTVALAVETAIAAYQDQNPDAKIEPTNAAWAKALEGFKMPGGGANDLAQFIKGGKIVDIMQREVKIEQASDGSIRVISSGTDGTFGTEDDVDSSMLRKLGEKALPKVKPPVLEGSKIE
jgi:hypothetical protein